jgi:uncharacterized protein with HEPN domain
MERLVRPALLSILEAVEGIQVATGDKSIESDWLLRHGVQRGIEIIAESVRRIPLELQRTQPQIPWTQIAGIGNVLRHEYHRVSDIVIWNVVQHHLPPLKAAVEAINAALQE